MLILSFVFLVLQPVIHGNSRVLEFHTPEELRDFEAFVWFEESRIQSQSQEFTDYYRRDKGEASYRNVNLTMLNLGHEGLKPRLMQTSTGSPYSQYKLRIYKK
ncbi:uncharacterized protein LOC111709102 [Eurytemora carolleeae]|uniref:uncharacterized protein LOC111709102 n=1 Tax=Eurytemora carolleeae TaxID=1294199 RepID=UPI000C785F13|nr:uncharacterized protein LOC111709102 [Eurytemora carolleeae]|eukprot:XP_023338470.1 uncharacterized protein LOC111709102 [Eurytemora affinis]